MGIYLSMLGNQKAVAGTNLRPDENYAREVMQLMSIGLVELNVDGTPKLDAAGQPIPTYNQDDHRGLRARVYGLEVGLPDDDADLHLQQHARAARAGGGLQPGQADAALCRAARDRHQAGAGPPAALPSAVIPAGQTGAKDLQDALDNIFNHPNVGPFISRQLIQKLVTSNPSPAYVQRVAEKFNNDGTGKRGNLEPWCARSCSTPRRARRPPARRSRRPARSRSRCCG